MREKLSGEIRADCAYTVREFCQRTGLGFQRVHEKFTVRRMAGRRFVLGRDFLDALSSENPPEEPR
jgi:hypothetical protein